MTAEPERPEDLASFYRRAFTEYGKRALWNLRPVDDPTPANALAITPALRTHGGMSGRRLAERIEELCRAARYVPVRRVTPAGGAAQPGQTTGRTEDGLPVHSFRTLLADLATLTRNTLVIAIDPERTLTVLARPTLIQQKALDLLGLARTQ